MLRDLVIKNRSYRRFYQDIPVKSEVLRELIDLSRLTPSTANRQPLKYIISTEPETNELIFSCLSWAGYLTDWDGPSAGEKPTGYIIILGDQQISKNYQTDAGIACQTILLGAVEKGLGGCIFGSVKRDKLKSELNITERYEIIYVVAIGKPCEEVVLERIDENGDIKYWRDEEGIHHVPKRLINEIVLGEYSKADKNSLK